VITFAFLNVHVLHSLTYCDTDFSSTPFAPLPLLLLPFVFRETLDAIFLAGLRKENLEEPYIYMSGFLLCDVFGVTAFAQLSVTCFSKSENSRLENYRKIWSGPLNSLGN
jgi:hypothetical protein